MEKPSTPAEMKAKAKRLPSDILSLAKRTVVPAAGQTAAAYGAGALADYFAPDTGGLSILIPLLARMAAAGGTNILTAKELPPEWGGLPEQSKTSDFLWGAIPQGIGDTFVLANQARGARNARRAVTEALESEDKAYNAAAGKMAKAIPKSLAAGPETADQLNILRGNLGGQGSAEAVTGEARRAAKNTLGSAVIGPIERMRATVGEPLGNAYRALENPVIGGMELPNPQFAEDVNELLATTRSPFSSETHSLARQVANLDPTSGGAVRPVRDALRLRQQITNRLRTAGGGDAHLLSDLQQILDQRLVNFLPDNIGDIRDQYRNFVSLYSWRKINALRNAATPEAVGDMLFSNPESNGAFAREVVQHATPAERPILKQAFYDKLARQVGVAGSSSDEGREIRNFLKPYVANGTLGDLIGPNDLRRLISLPEAKAALAAHAATPLGRHLTETGIVSALKSGEAPADAVQRGLENLIDALPPAEQKRIAEMAGMDPHKWQAIETPLLPSNLPRPLEARNAGVQRALIEHYKSAPYQAAGKVMQMFGSRMAFAPFYILMGLLTGRSFGYAYGAAAMLGGGFIGSYIPLRNAILNHGGAEALAKFWTSSSQRELGRNFVSLLAAMGTQTGQRNFPDQAKKRAAP